MNITQTMKKFSLMASFYLIIGMLSFLFSIQAGHCQENLIGTWEGVFMNDFLAVINFDKSDENKFEGNIKMFAGSNLIQDDNLSDIKLTNHDFTFNIPAKETSFEGSFNTIHTELSGEFVFPDGSKHPIQLKRKKAETVTVEEFRLVKERKFDMQELHSDLMLLYTSLKEHHPQLYTFCPKDSLDLLAKKILSEMDEPLTLEEFYLKTAKLTNAVYCSHTGVKLPSTYQNLVNEFGNYFPLRLFFGDGRAFYISGMPEGAHLLSPGNEIVSINDKSIKEIIKGSFYYIPSEGCNTTTKYNELNQRFNELFYLLDDSENFTVKYKTGDSIQSITVNSSRLSDIKLDYAIMDNARPVDFSYINNKTIGLLKVSSFAIPEMDHYLYQLDSIFIELKADNIQNLIVDLRNNTGGHPIFAAQLFSYLSDKEFIYFKRNEEVSVFEPLYNTMQPNELNFTGNVFVFINGGCLSTTGHLISLLKFYTDAIFIGEEPGSTFRCNDFSMQIALPKSGILVNIPRTTFETSVSGFALCESFPLDFKVKINAIDIITGEDSYLDIVLKIVEE